jgi:hypothetical protein
MSAVVKDYPTPASNADVIRKHLLAGRHLIILNRSSYAPDVKTEAISGRHYGAREYRYIHFA